MPEVYLQKQPSEMFIIQTFKKMDGGGELSDSKDDRFIYCPVSELKYLIDNTNDKSVIEWFYIRRAFRAKDMSWVDPKEVFGE